MELTTIGSSPQTPSADDDRLVAADALGAVADDGAVRDGRLVVLGEAPAPGGPHVDAGSAVARDDAVGNRRVATLAHLNARLVIIRDAAVQDRGSGAVAIDAPGRGGQREACQNAVGLFAARKRHALRAAIDNGPGHDGGVSRVLGPQRQILAGKTDRLAIETRGHHDLIAFVGVLDRVADVVVARVPGDIVDGPVGAGQRGNDQFDPLAPLFQCSCTPRLCRRVPSPSGS